MNNSYYPLLMVLLIVALGIGGRLLLMRLVHTACPALRFRIKAALFVLYPLALILMLRQVYLSVLRGQHDRPLCRFSLPDSRREAPALRQR